jgi:hypothetical protein
MLDILIKQYKSDQRYIANISNECVLPSVLINDSIFFYRIDCLGGVPLVVFLYDLYGKEGIEQYFKIKINHCLHINNGIYPLTVESIEKFCCLYIETLKNCSYIGCWNKGYIPELYLIEKYCKNKAVASPYNSGHYGQLFWFNKNDWYTKLQNKKILIISSHAETMKKQWYSNQIFLSHDKNITHKDTGINLSFIKPPVSICRLTPHSSWEQGLEILKSQILDEQLNFDIALVSCGCYGAEVCNFIYKTLNKSVFYIGGALQLYFSIIGNRWSKESFINKYWTSVLPEEVPLNAKLVENSCYY